MRKLPKIRELWGDWKAKRRGERRVAPYGARGRIYERDRKGDVSDVKASQAEPIATLEMKVIRANGETKTLRRPVNVKVLK